MYMDPSITNNTCMEGKTVKKKKTKTVHNHQRNWKKPEKNVLEKAKNTP